jgi:hypothetical protein
MRPIRCPKCDEANAPVSVYCQKCGTILTSPRKGMLEEMIEHPEVAEKFFQHPRIQAALQRFLDRMKELEAIKEK